MSDREPKPEIVGELDAIGVQWMEDVAGAPRAYWRNTAALDYCREMGALAQAARNFLLSRSDMDLRVLDRLAAEAVDAPRLFPAWSDAERLSMALAEKSE